MYALGFPRLSGSKRLYRKGDTARETESLVEPMTDADRPSAIPGSRFIPNAVIDCEELLPTPGLMRLGDGGLGILQYRPTVANPPETRALAKLTLTESRNPG